MKHLAILSVLVTGCTGATYTTKHGIEVVCRSDTKCWPQEDVEALTAAFAEQANEWWLPVVLDGLKVEVKATASGAGFDCDIEHHPEANSCFGTLAKNKKHIELAWRECLARSEFVHELGHLIQRELYGFEDPHHKDDKIFPDACYTDDSGWRTPSEVACANQALIHRVQEAVADTCE